MRVGIYSDGPIRRKTRDGGRLCRSIVRRQEYEENDDDAQTDSPDNRVGFQGIPPTFSHGITAGITLYTSIMNAVIQASFVAAFLYAE